MQDLFAVSLVKKADWNSDLFICDVTSEHSFFEKLKKINKKIVVTCHGFLNELHGLDPQHVKSSLSFANLVHFVSSAQQESFRLEKESFKIIPNTVKSINKNSYTNNVGCVGNLNDERKNANETVNISLKSNASFIHLWSVDDDKWKTPRVITHRWESNKDKIYNTFDVLVFVSHSETFGLVVIEAMSAGMPCVLSSIPAFEQFRGCPGVHILESGSYIKPYDIINKMLQDKDKLKPDIIEYFEANYSEVAVAKQWHDTIARLLNGENIGKV